MASTRNLKYLWSLLPGILTIAGNYLGSWWAISNFIFSLMVLAILEQLLPEDKSNQAESDSGIPDAILCTHFLFQILSLAVLFYSIREGRISGYFLVFAMLSTGVHTGSSSIIVAHEMIHRKSRHWQWAGKFLLLTAGNIYFYVDHLRVHHKWVGTVNDPATARKGESLYSFFLRSSIGQVRSSYNLEKERLAKLGLTSFHYRNYIVASVAILLAASFLIYEFVGIYGLAVFAGQCLLANFLLEYINYIEHYGLSRSLTNKVDTTLSWQSDKVISRFMLIDLSRHSDHHFLASKPYHTLHSHSDSPVLPGGYASCIYLALIPVLWFRIIDPKINTTRK
ncbi:MAG TPA: alkane 1-monooxygenase [Bacteroidia bacterium]|nr:alkane 1-monooxygenase [Bacteroidia bacterium]